MKTTRLLAAFGASAQIVLVLPISAAQAQSDPPKVHQKLVDQHGVDRKTGRFGLSIPPLLAVGGDGDSALSATFGFIDGTDFQQNVPVWIRNNPGVYDGKTGKTYDYVTVEFNGNSDTFRRQTSTNGAFVPEYPSGSSYSLSGNSQYYQDKFGNSVSLSGPFGSALVVNYADGRQTKLYYPNGYSQSSAAYIAFTGVSPDRTIVNNFGYMIKISRDSVYRIQAVNLAQDYCDPSSISVCATSHNRQAYIQSAATTRTLVNAAGGQAVYRFAAINANDRMRVRNQFSGGPPCDTPTAADLWYPVGITPFGASQEVYTIAYTKRPATGDCTQDPTHDDVFVSSVSGGGLTAQYTTAKRYYGSYGSNPYNLSFWLGVSSQINGQNGEYSEANRPDQEWGASRRSLTSTKDGLGQQTSYNFNDLVEPAGFSLPEGNGEQLTYDARYNVIQRSVRAKGGPAQQVTRYTYPDNCNAANLTYCNKPMNMIDARGAQTDYAYNSMGQLVSETSPAGSDGVRPRRILTYSMRTAYIKDGGGNVVPAGPAISLLTRLVECSTATACDGSSLDDVTTDYDHGSTSGLNNLALRGMTITGRGQGGAFETRRTCYSYNYFGERVSQTKPLGTGGGCS